MSVIRRVSSLFHAYPSLTHLSLSLRFNVGPLLFIALKLTGVLTFEVIEYHFFTLDPYLFLSKFLNLQIVFCVGAAPTHSSHTTTQTTSSTTTTSSGQASFFARFFFGVFPRFCKMLLFLPRFSTAFSCVFM